MEPTLAYPETRYAVSPLVDLTARTTRQRLSPPAIRGFFNIVDAWQLRDEDARGLLGLSNGAYYDWKKTAERVIDADRLTRISYLVGIYKALNILHGKAIADDWVRLPNANRLFGGSTPLAYMTRGGLPAMQTVRRLLDARRAGT